MIEPNADRDAILSQMRRGVYPAGIPALIDADDLLIVDLCCPTCGGVGESWADHVGPCPTCHGTGRRDVKVVDAESWDRFIRSERRDADQFERLAAVVRWALRFHRKDRWPELDALTADDIEAVADALH